MGLFKKKERPVITELKCPAEGCNFTSTDAPSMKRHMEWKHPGTAGDSGKTAAKVK